MIYKTTFEVTVLSDYSLRGYALAEILQEEKEGNVLVASKPVLEEPLSSKEADAHCVRLGLDPSRIELTRDIQTRVRRGHR